MLYKLEDFIDQYGNKPFERWFSGLRDLVAKKEVAKRLLRVKNGNFGDCHPVGGGVWELRIHVGQGYRVYHARMGNRVILLLCGGIKKGQKSDIKLAQSYYQYQLRKERGKL